MDKQDKLTALAPRMYEALMMVHKACGPAAIWNGKTADFLTVIEGILSEVDEYFDPYDVMEEMKWS